MNLTIKTLKGAKFVVEAEPSNTVGEVKTIIVSFGGRRRHSFVTVEFSRIYVVAICWSSCVSCQDFVLSKLPF